MFWKGTYDIEHCKCLRAMQADFVRLDQDILTPLAGKKKLYTFETNDFWEQIKTPGWVQILGGFLVFLSSVWKFYLIFLHIQYMMSTIWVEIK